MGQMLKPLMDMTNEDLQAELNSYTPGSGLAWQRLFPLKFTPRFDLKAIEGDEGIPVSADRVAFNTKAPQKTRKTIGQWSGQLGKIAVSRTKDELDINEYQSLQNVSLANPDDTATAKYLVDLVFDDVKFCNDAMDYKVEVDSLRIGSSGKRKFDAKIDGNLATQDEINFNVPKENFGGAAVKWSEAATADGLADIANWQKKIAKKGVRKPMYAFMSDGAFERLCAQKSTMTKVASALLNATGLATTDSVNIQSINAYMRKYGRPEIVIIDSYVTIEDAEGKKTTIQPWNDNVCVLSPELRLGYTYYKPVPTVKDSAALQQYGSYYKMTRYSDVNPMIEVTMAEAYVQPALSNRASLVFINTANTNWNEGAE